MIAQKKFKRYAVALLVIYLPQVFMPTGLFALTGGPSQPEVQSFEPVGTSDMVDIFSGDFNYNIPLLDVGGYPVNISYHSGVSMDQEASWVGLGWNINPGVINRSMRGIPDDHGGDEVKKETNLRTNRTMGISTSPDLEIFGLSKLKFSNLGIFYNNYRGVGYEFSIGATLPLISNKLKGGLNVNFNSHNGIDVSPSLSFDGIIKKKESDALTYGFSASAGYNSRGGLKSMTIGKSLGIDATNQVKTGVDSEGNPIMSDYRHVSKGFNGGSNISFGTATYTPSISMPMSSLSVSLNAAFGTGVFGAFPDFNLKGYYSHQKLREKSTTKRSFGYLYMGNSLEDDILLDFNREKDGEFSDNATNLAIPQLTYDIYSVSGQGIGGMYRLHRGDYGVVYDHDYSSISTSASLGAEFGVGAWAHFGANANVNFSKTQTNKWWINNDFVKSLDFENAEKIRRTDPYYEGAYFKNAGEKTPVDGTFQNIIGGTLAVKIPVGNHDWERPFARSKLVGNNNYSKNISGQKPDNVKKKRDKRNQTISYLTVREAIFAGLDKDYKTYDLNGVYENGVLDKTSISRGGSLKKDHHISEITSTGADGRRYVYGIPAYNNKQIEKTFNVSNEALSPICSKGQVVYTSGDDSKDNTNGDDHFFSSTETPAYAHSYLLTAILSPDYADITGDGVTDDDIGTAVKINYTRVYTDYKWRIPYQYFRANYEEGLKFSEKDDKASYVYGEKEVWHMHSVESKNQIAVFKISLREDGYGVIDENGGLDGGSASYKLDSIVLYSKQDYIRNGENAEPIKVVHFEYDYSLCPDVENNSGNTVTVNGADINLNKGKLTLKKIFFTYGSSQKGRLTPYTFEYNSINPAYNLKGYDRWGNYTPNTGQGCGTFAGAPTTAEYPYTTQVKDSADKYMAAWTLTKINLPMGGSINVTYEADDYAYVQDKQAMQMVKILGFSESSSFSTSNKLFTKTGLSLSDSYLESEFLFFRLKNAITGAGAAEKMAQQYFTGIDNMYFNAFVDIDGYSNYEYVRGYAEINRGATDCFGVINDTIGWVKLSTERIGDRQNGGAKVHPIAKAAWNFARLYAPQLVFPFSYANETIGEGATAHPIIAMLGFAQDAKRMFQGFNRSLRQEGFGQNVQLSRSWIRVNVPDKIKLGGGVRVKKIAINDNWAVMGAENTAAADFEYGQEYTYTKSEAQPDGTILEISSGVASYEPMIGGEENPWHKPVYTTKENKLAPDDRFYKEEPFGESFFPSPSIGYSKVTVKNLGHDNVIRNATGSQVHEFYTAYDFPTKVTQTGLDKFHKKPNPVLKLFNIEVREKVTASQGYMIELNDMHGKPKSSWTYAENADKPLSGMQYFYKEIKDQKQLDNVVKTVSKNGSITSKTVGVDIDFVADMREQKTKSYSGGVQFNTEVIPAWIIPLTIPIILPSYQSDQSSFHSAVTCKVVNRYGILERTMAYQEGSVITTENELFDDETGEVLLTSVQNEFKDNLYNFTYPAHWAYEGMAGAYKNSGLILYDVRFGIDTIVLPNGLNPRDYLMAGDQVVLLDNTYLTSSKEAWVYDGTDKLNLIDRNGIPLVLPNPTRRYTLKVVRPARRNMQSVPIGAITSLSNPASTSTLTFSNIIDAATVEFNDRWATFCDYFKLYECSDTIYSQEAYDLETFMDYLAQDSLLGNLSRAIYTQSWFNSWYTGSSLASVTNQCNDTLPDTALYYLDPYGMANYQVPINHLEFYVTPFDGVGCCKIELSSDTTFDFGEIRAIDSLTVDLNQNVNGTNYNFEVVATLKNGNKVTLGGTNTCFNLITCEYSCGVLSNNHNKPTNPFLVGLRGNWRKTRDYKYLEERNYSSNIDIRTDATYKTFSSYWAYNSSSGYVEPQNNGKWVWASEVTKYNPFGEEIENKDALGRYTAALYGYNNTLPVAVGSNAKYNQLGFDGFEDYNYLYSSNPCQLYHWNFKTSLPGTAKLDSLEQHSGKYSLKIDPNTTHSVERQIVSCSNETPNNDSAVMYKFKPCDCIGLFSPDSGKYVFSGWIKDSTSALDTTYSEPTIRVTVTTGSGSQNIDLKGKGPIIDGWQRVEEYITLPYGTTTIEVILMAGANPVWFDDLRIHPFDGNMKTFVYHPISLKLFAELDENNFATFYEYDKEGALIRVKKETVNGVMTIKESRNGLIKQ